MQFVVGGKRNVQAEIYDNFKDVKYLSPTEKEIYKGLKTTRAKEFEENMIKKAVGAVLSSEEEVTLADGTKITVTKAERLAARTVQEALQNPSTGKLKDLAHVMGEDKMVIETPNGGANFFLGICRGDKVDEIVEPEGEK